jgi:Core-2/I-Branching enzyme
MMTTTHHTATTTMIMKNKEGTQFLPNETTTNHKSNTCSQEQHPSNSYYPIQRRIRYYGMILVSFISLQLLIFHKQAYHIINSIQDQSSSSLTSEETKDTGKQNDTPPSSTIAFMFMMATDQPMHQDIWERWFRSADSPSKYSIVIHHSQKAPQHKEEALNFTKHSHPFNTTDPIVMKTIIKKLDRIDNVTVPIPLNSFFCPYVIPSVSTSYYCCLYRGMMQILQTAYERDPFAAQFIFISTTTIPLISFDELYHQLIILPNSNNNNNNNTTTRNNFWKSRFCFMESQQRVWRYMVKVLQLNIDHVRKAEMWSILSREHVQLLLNNQHIMDDWYLTFQRERSLTYSQKIYIGAPDEMFFSTMLNVLQQDGKVSQDHYRSFFQEDCLLKSIIPTTTTTTTTTEESCCMTKVFWPSKRGQPIHVTNETTGLDTIRLSDKCIPNNPCVLRGLLYEEGLKQLQSIGYYFLRKIPNDKNDFVVVQTLSNETISLYDALYYLHQREPMKKQQQFVTTTTPITTSTIESSQSMLSNQHHHQRLLLQMLLSQSPRLIFKEKHRCLQVDDNNEQHDNQNHDENFQCFVQPVIDIEQCWCNGLIHV